MTDSTAPMPAAVHVLEPVGAPAAASAVAPAVVLDQTNPRTSEAVWSPATRLAFRFCFVYFGLYVLTTQMLSGPIPGANIPDLGHIGVVKALVVAVGKYLLQLKDVPVHPTGSGDTLFDYVHAFTLLLIAAISTALWTVRAKAVVNHATLNKWFRIVARWAVATTMFTYGLDKVIPLQMPIISLARLVEPFGDFSMMGVLWYSIGAAPAYEIFVGLAEVLAGVLLFLPRTAMFGAMVALMDGIGIFALNMTYDVPVKLFAFHIVLFSVVLLAPNLRGLFNLFFAQKTMTPVPEAPIGKSQRSQRNFVIAQGTVGVLTILAGILSGISASKIYGFAAPRSPLFGIWSVEEMSVDNRVLPPLTTDTSRYKHIIFQQPTFATIQKMDDHFSYLQLAVDSVAKTITISKSPGGNRGAGVAPAKPDSQPQPPTYTYQRISAKELILDGEPGGHKTHLVLKLRPEKEFTQKKLGFHWIQEYPVNR